MKKQLFTVFLTCCVTLSLCACGAKQPVSESTENMEITPISEDGSQNEDSGGEFEIDTKVRLAGTHDEFTEVIDADIGDQVEYQIEFHNASAITLENVIIRDVLPENMAYIAGTTYLYNSNHEDGELLPADGDIFADGSNIGNYSPGASGWVRFTAEIIDKSLADGDNALVNWAQGMVGSTTHQDHAKVNVKR